MKRNILGLLAVLMVLGACSGTDESGAKGSREAFEQVGDSGGIALGQHEQALTVATCDGFTPYTVDCFRQSFCSYPCSSVSGTCRGPTGTTQATAWRSCSAIPLAQCENYPGCTRTSSTVAATLFAHSYARVQIAQLGPGEEDPGLDYNDEASSIHVQPGYCAKVYRDTGLRGSSLLFREGVYGLGHLNDEVSSWKIVSCPAPPSPPDDPCGCLPLPPDQWEACSRNCRL